MKINKELKEFDFNSSSGFSDFKNYHKSLMENERKKYFILTVLALSNAIDNVINHFKEKNFPLVSKEIEITKEVTYNSGKRDTVSFEVSLLQSSISNSFRESLVEEKDTDYDLGYDVNFDNHDSDDDIFYGRSENRPSRLARISVEIDNSQNREFVKIISPIVQELKKVPSTYTPKQQDPWFRLKLNLLDPSLKEKILSFSLNDELLKSLNASILDSSLTNNNDQIKTKKIKV